MKAKQAVNVLNFLAFKCFLVSLGRLGESCNLIGFGRGRIFPVSALCQGNHANAIEWKLQNKMQIAIELRKLFHL